jgi:hypothetical protein
MVDNMIQIVLLHYNQPDVLVRCVRAINDRTRYPFKIFIVDNSNLKTEAIKLCLKNLADDFGCVVLYNYQNDWIYGFNLAIKSKEWVVSQYYVFSDSDIIVPETGCQECWLSYLVRQMNEHVCIGKLGLNLSLDNLKTNPNLNATLRHETRLQQGPRIGENIVAAVDTTLAIYRSDVFVTNFSFTLGHATLVRPSYYVCRTKSDVSAIHVGWDFYPGSTSCAQSLESDWDKSKNLARYGAQVAPEIAQRFSFAKQLYLQLLLSIVRFIHGVKVVFLVGKYLFTRFPKKINHIKNGGTY